MKRPSFQAYPADWRKDLELGSCSIGARGLWWELCCVMHEATPYGHLTLNGAPMDDAKAARACRVDLREYRKLLSELEASGVPSRTDAGVLYSRRMVKDEDTRNARAAGGPKGAEFGALGAEGGKQGGRPRKAKGANKPPLPEEQKPPPSSSVSSSTAENKGVASQPLSGLAPDHGHETATINGHKPGSALTHRLTIEAKQILAFLNERAGKKFPPTDSNIGIIVARFREEFEPAQLRQVIAFKVRQWKDDPEMREYLRPETLFNRKKFSSYVGELVDTPTEQEGQSA